MFTAFFYFLPPTIAGSRADHSPEKGYSMNENQITPEVEEAESQIEGAETDVETDEDGWPTEWADATEENDNEGDTDEVTPEADQQPEEPQPENDQKGEEPKPEEPAPEQQSEEADQFLELKHMDQVKKVNREEAKALAQKGLDYDRIRGERDSMKAEHGKLKEYESFLNELKGEFPSIEAMITDTRARMLAEKDGISYTDAVAKVKIMHPEQPQQEEPAREDQPQGNEAVQRFVQLYPDVKAEEIPESVWAEVKKTGDLVGAYRDYERQKQADEIASLRNKIATLEKNQENAARSPGSMNSSGKTSSKSLIQQLWDEDDY